jgi:hypothetical protein
MLPRKAPTAAMTMLRAMSFLAPNRSENTPAGMANRTVQRVGIAAIRPICWLVSINSSLRTGKSVERMLPAAWTRAWITTVMRSPKLRSLAGLLLSSLRAESDITRFPHRIIMVPI